MTKDEMKRRFTEQKTSHSKQKWQEYGYYSEESFNHYLNRQQKVFLGHLRSLKTWRDFYGLKQRLYMRDTQKHKSLFHPWRKQTLMEIKPQI